MLPHTYSLKGIHSLPVCGHSNSVRPFTSSNRCPRSLVAQAEPDILDKPILRRPEPPKPEPKPEESSQQKPRPQQDGNKALRNGNGQAQRGGNRSGPPRDPSRNPGQQYQARNRNNGASNAQPRQANGQQRSGPNNIDMRQQQSNAPRQAQQAPQSRAKDSTPIQTQQQELPPAPALPDERQQNTVAVRQQASETAENPTPEEVQKPKEDDPMTLSRPSRPARPAKPPPRQQNSAGSRSGTGEASSRQQRLRTPSPQAQQESQPGDIPEPTQESGAEEEVPSHPDTEAKQEVASPGIEAQEISLGDPEPQTTTNEENSPAEAAQAEANVVQEANPLAASTSIEEDSAEESISAEAGEPVKAAVSSSQPEISQRNEISTLDMAKSGNQSNAGPPQEGKQLLRAPQRMQRQVQRSVSQKFDRSASFRRQEMELRARRKSEAGAAGGDATPREQTWQEMAEESIDEEAEEEVEEGETTEEAPEALERPSAAVQSMDEAAPSAPLMAKPSRSAASKQAVPPSRLLRRMPSEQRRSEAEGGEANAASTAARPRQQAQAWEGPAKESGSNARDSKKKGSTRRRYEKPDIEKQRQSRYERRQQRQERNEAEALEQEEIFEVGSEGMSVQNLAEKLACNGGDVMKALFMKGIMVQVNQVLDKEMVKAVAEEYGVEVLDLEEAGLEKLAEKQGSQDQEDAGQLEARPPVVTVMGHVDHGKTSLLDFIRKTKIASGEAGGITQAIGAYTCQVETGDGEKNITFIDTPGHEAFTAMRARGAKVTDIVIIMVACDDGVRPQTREAIGHAKAAKVPIIVALNKVDKEGANPERAKQEISEAGLLPEEWGGDTPMIEISAKKGTGVDDLLETVLLMAELEQLSANPSRAARGTVVEANMHPRLGPVATLLVAAGTLKTGDVFHAGAAYGKVRVIKDSSNKNVESAGPSVAVLVGGLNNVPVAGDEFTVMETEQEARKVAAAIEDSQRLARLNEQAGGTMVTGVSFATMDPEESDGLQHLNVILKADASGSLEAVKAALLGMPQDRVTLRFLMTAAGPINSGDVQLANASQGQIISFNMDPSEAIIAQAKRLGVAMKAYKVIYELIDDVRDLMEGRLSTVEERLPLGEAEVRAVFGSGSRRVAGCMVTEGLLRRGCLVQVMRGKKHIHEGELTSLRRVKENVTEMSQGNECGVGVSNFIEWREGDKIAALEVKFKRQTLEEASQRELTSNLQSWEDEELELEAQRR